MLIYLVAKLDWHSINLQLNSVVLVIHVDVADKKQTQALHLQLPGHPAILILIINNVILTDPRSSR